MVAVGVVGHLGMADVGVVASVVLAASSGAVVGSVLVENVGCVYHVDIIGVGMRVGVGGVAWCVLDVVLVL